MPLVEFTPENKTKAFDNYPKLSLERGERARVVLVEERPLLKFIHDLKQTRIENGKVVMETFKTKNGEEKERVAKDFVARYLCPGDDEVLGEKGYDPESCPVCAAAKETDAVTKPEPRYAMHIIRYSLKPGTFDISEPFSINLIGWSYSPKVFNTLVDLHGQWGDLRKHDLLLGPCESKQYQKFDIAIAPKCEWTAEASRKKLVKETYEANRTDDLASIIGRVGTQSQIREDLETVLHRHKVAFSDSVSEQSVAAPVETEPAIEAALEEVSDEAVSFDDLLADL